MRTNFPWSPRPHCNVWSSTTPAEGRIKLFIVAKAFPNHTGAPALRSIIILHLALGWKPRKRVPQQDKVYPVGHSLGQHKTWLEVTRWGDLVLGPCTGMNITKAQCQLCTGFHWALIQALESNHEPKEMNLHLWNTQIRQEVLAAGKARLAASQQSEPGKGGLVGTSHPRTHPGHALLPAGILPRRVEVSQITSVSPVPNNLSAVFPFE